MNLGRQFDVIISDGVIHHTVAPTESFNNLINFLKPDGLMIIMVYSKEGNWINKYLLNPISQYVFQKLSPVHLLRLSKFFACILSAMEKTIYRFNFKFLPFRSYLTEYYAKMSSEMQTLDVYDQINAPLVHYIPRSMILAWFNDQHFYDVVLRHEKGVTWVGSGKKRD
jgi:SAM-dependent methyltransferase